MRTVLRLVGPVVAVSGAAIAAGRFRRVGYMDEKPFASLEKDAELINWSSTHELTTKSLYQPESTEELVNTLKKCQEDGLRIRPMGSGLSPNGIGFDQEGTVGMGLLDNVWVSPQKGSTYCFSLSLEA
uniref:FAD-binding PCMH-type domain-containing protein n=1 Tax=Rhodosorus marinus TaxID=101924 RepID=A0A7S3A6Q9_9RHOD|mmetsp:Transcript_5472/g.23243  ORF Transcript_5472/g.23243 Transcript_5472/m.23243 type:complete len:128 (+) Transcript_5472:229-612(+)